MSAVIRSVTPFLEKELLLQSLDELEIAYQISGSSNHERIQVLQGGQYFSFEGGRYKLV